MITGGFGARRSVDSFMEHCNISGSQNTYDAWFDDDMDKKGSLFGFIDKGVTFDAYFCLTSLNMYNTFTCKNKCGYNYYAGYIAMSSGNVHLYNCTSQGRIDGRGSNGYWIAWI